MALRKIETLPPSGVRFTSRHVSWGRISAFLVVSFIFLPLLFHPLTPSVFHSLNAISKTNLSSLCPQAEPLSPSLSFSVLAALDGYLSSDSGRKYVVDSLSGAVKIPTQTYDDIGPPGNDSRWDIFKDIHSYLKKRFPLVHASLETTTINQYALLYRWKGYNPSLKPIVFTAHQDVVPVNQDTLDEWNYPPFAGVFDGTHVWGRGSADDKAMLIGLLSAVEMLLEQEFKPARTVILAYGFDEERGGRFGAREISKHLQEIYGRNGAAMLVDEGGPYKAHAGFVMAMPSVAEKGALNVKIEVLTPGGHSSVPPPHTGIGFLASLITTLEGHPFPASLRRDSTWYRTLQCEAAHDTSIPAPRRALIAQSSTDDCALAELERQLISDDGPGFQAYSGTTQAIDVIQGGVKVNALPEGVYAIANHRIAEWSSTADVRAHYINVLGPAATALNLSLEAFGQIVLENQTHPTAGHIRLTTLNRGLRPAPVSPTEGSGAWALLSGTILSSLKTTIRTDIEVKGIAVAPAIMIANSDTKWYWNLTSNIFRYNHIGVDDHQGMHTVNEAIKFEACIEAIRFYARLILNADETHLLDD
ncbi:carboxypeptidase S [Vararia minispora EC-137]|uniref:Carboxypeptidase S n=1 Tax=Vararia minispora EC-137 TaxID=1314806 RepID=A0ACB8QMQ0_9AGAM|nr:carboxypeptidase S [Vararia minispora EC-137]